METWATYGTDLYLELDASGTQVRRALEDALRRAIQAGRLHQGTRLPSSRALAADLGLARNTVADGYGQLIAEGWLVARHGSGTWVAERGPADPPRADPPAQAGPERAVPRYSLAAGHPDLSAFPRAAWLAAARRALATAPAAALGYGDPRGRPELRAALADYLSRARGVRATADRIVVCSGFTQALGLLAQVLAARGAASLAVEEFGHRYHREVIAARGLAVAPVPVDDRGAVITALAGAGGGAGAVLLTPAHQFPLGVPLAAARRSEAAGWAAATGATVIEDDYDGEFRYDRQAIGAMQALAPERVVYAGTASKTLAPGLRLAWLVLPRDLADDVAQAKLLADTHTSVVDQLTLAELITSGGYDRHVRRCRQAYRRRRERLAAALRQHAPQARITGVAAGLHAVVELPAGLGEADAIADAQARGLIVSGLGEYATAGARHPPALVVGFATPPPHSFTTAIARLCAVIGRVPVSYARGHRTPGGNDAGQGQRGVEG
jgi:GntR family transcriptional regulator / MocR family aminotransferase